MPAELASLICVLFIIFLFWKGDRAIGKASKALWIPFIWIFIAASREVSQWLALGRPRDPFSKALEASPLDGTIYAVLIAAGIIVLLSRRPDWGQLILRNAWIWLYFLFGLISVLWSDYPLVSLTRLIKATGNVVMALVILTEERPYQALEVILTRIAFVLLPLSLLLIKYFPQLGRTYHVTGRQMLNGVSTHKNGLGQLCLIVGICLIWSLLFSRDDLRERDEDAPSAYIDLIVLALAVWLLLLADSATSQACLLITVVLLLCFRIPSIRAEPRRAIYIGAASVAFLGLLETTLNVSDLVFPLLGRDATLTTRVPMWYYLAELAVNPMLGAGYESFWYGDRLHVIWRQYFGFRNSHNGYLETYLNVGLIGLFILAGSMISGMIKVWKRMNIDYSAFVLRFCLIVVIAVYNWTEVSFQGVNELWLLLFLSIMDPPEIESEIENGIGRVSDDAGFNADSS